MFEFGNCQHIVKDNATRRRGIYRGKYDICVSFFNILRIINIVVLKIIYGMKKLLGCVLAVMMCFAACEGPVGPPGKDGRDGKNGSDGYSTQWFVGDFDVLSAHWEPVYDDLMGDIFQYEFHIPELTEFIFKEGAVICYLLQNINKGGRTTLIQTPLPYTFYGDAGGELYSENYTCEIRQGYINFIVKISDFNTQAQQPLPCTFRVVMMW